MVFTLLHSYLAIHRNLLFTTPFTWKEGRYSSCGTLIRRFDACAAYISHILSQGNCHSHSAAWWIIHRLMPLQPLQLLQVVVCSCYAGQSLAALAVHDQKVI